MSIENSTIDPDVSSHLEPMWVRLHGITEHARKGHIIKVMSKSIDNLVVVDDLLLTWNDPI